MLKPTLSSSPLESKTRFRVQLKHAVAIGPGKADVLQAIAETGSIAESGRRLGMSYQRVWSLVRAMNNDFIEPLVVTQRGGNAGGGAQLTATGASSPRRGPRCCRSTPASRWRLSRQWQSGCPNW